MLVPLNESSSLSQSIQLEIETLGEFSEPVRPACYITNRNQIDVVCHHCGRPIHIFGQNPLKDNRYRRRLSKQLQQQDSNPFPQRFIHLINKIPSFRDREFANLGLDQGTPIHCEYCQHHASKVFRLLVASLAIFIILLGIAYLQIVTFPIYALLMILWGTIVGYIIFSNLDRMKTLFSIDKPPFPLMGRATTININEFLEGTIKLTQDAEYITTTQINSCRGTLEYSSRITQSDLERFNKYLQKFKLGKNKSFQFLTSFLLFDNLRPVLFENPHHLIPDRVNTLRIRGGGNVYCWREKIKSPLWSIVHPYKIIIDPKQEQVTTPLQVFPTIISEGNRTALELTVQVNPNIWNKSFLRTDITIKEFSIKSHPEIELGPVLAAHPPHFPHDGTSHVTWRKIKLTPPSEEDLYEQFGDSIFDPQDQLIPTQQFYVRFESDVLKDNEIQGILVAQFNDTLSGIDNIQIFNALGYKVNMRKDSVKRQTEITLHFTLSLQCLSIREHFSPFIPPIKEPVKPDSRLVNKLVAEIIRDGRTYIKRVIENPPQTNQANAKVINRFWDIAGRQYIGVYPIDFHLVLIGTEKYSNKDTADCGETQFEVKISANTSNDEMKQKVESLQDRLLHIIDEVSAQLQ